MSLRNALLVASLGTILGGCASEPVAVKYEAPKPVVDLCCQPPMELVRYKNKPTADCAKDVEVVHYKNSCTDCPYPVVVRSDNNKCFDR
jgi:hypothetical protein